MSWMFASLCADGLLGLFSSRLTWKSELEPTLRDGNNPLPVSYSVYQERGDNNNRYKDKILTEVSGRNPVDKWVAAR